MGYHIQQNIAYPLDNCIRFLAFVKSITNARVHSDDIVNVPENLLEEVESSILRDDIRALKRTNPGLEEKARLIQTKTEKNELASRTSRRYSISRTKSRSV